MAKRDEMDHINRVVEADSVSKEDFQAYLLAAKPYSDPNCGKYLQDIGQILNLIPPPPARILDVGVGSGWTSEMFARRGYEVVGLDISPDMIELAKKRTTNNLSFIVCDYEIGPVPGKYDIAVIYDALHHAENETLVVQNIFDALDFSGILVTIEPGQGHSQTPDSILAMQKYGTTEKDMPFSRQHELMKSAGFNEIEQYIRISQLPIIGMSDLSNAVSQVRHCISLSYESATGYSSIVLARKGVKNTVPTDPSQQIARALLSLSVEHDKCANELTKRGR
jgi:SAM-dependent methyltransferase